MKPRDFIPLMDRLRMVVRVGRVLMADDSVAPQMLQIQTRQGEIENGIPRYQPHGLRSLPVAGAQAILKSLGGFRRNTLAATVDAGRLGAQYLQPGDVALDDYRGLVIHLGQTALLIEGAELPLKIHSAASVTIDAPVVETTRNLAAGNGATGSFTTPTGQVVTVQDGIVTNIQ